jgi:hypothetical protein
MASCCSSVIARLLIDDARKLEMMILELVDIPEDKEAP